MQWLTREQEERLWDEKDKYRIKCKCGHTNVIINPKGYKLCSWCKRYVFLTPKVEFEFRLKQKIIKERRNNK